ncbi:hypothetical protein FACS1894153_2160 [Bacteroidia bacterium]|nr:hypothetical protein FACS1894153_2160 [Bacteroidia bacterium]
MWSREILKIKKKQMQVALWQKIINKKDKFFLQNFVSVIFFFILILFPSIIFAQYDDDKSTKLFGFSFGTGAYWASKYVAAYYNGSENNENKLSYVLDNSYWHEEIRQELNVGKFELYEHAMDMQYKVAMPINIRFFMNVGGESRIFVEFNRINLLAVGIFTLKTDSVTFTSEPALKVCNIWGGESRTMFDLGYRYGNPTDGPYNWFFEGGISFVQTVAKENRIKIGNFEQSIMNRGSYIPGQPMYEPMRQQGIGIGVFANIGIEVLVTKALTIDIGGQFRTQDINLGNYKDFNKAYGLFIKINFVAF